MKTLHECCTERYIVLLLQDELILKFGMKERTNSEDFFIFNFVNYVSLHTFHKLARQITGMTPAAL
jgi:hypothetical protein